MAFFACMQCMHILHRVCLGGAELIQERNSINFFLRADFVILIGVEWNGQSTLSKYRAI